MKLLFRSSAIIILNIFLSNLSLADSYSGTAYNWETGEYYNVDIEFNGSELEVYNWNTGDYEYHDIDTNNGDGTFETYNWQTGENNTIELD